MSIEICTSDELSESEWNQYARAFNEVFDRNFSVTDLQQKYFNTIDQLSYHALLLNQPNGEIVGSCTAIPHLYEIGGKKIRTALIVDIFVKSEHRSNPMAMFLMYQKLKAYMLSKEIGFVIAVPNQLSFPYWEKIVGLQVVGRLPVYVLPVRLGNIVGRFKKILNYFNTVFLMFLQFINRITVYPVWAKERSIELKTDTAIMEQQRFGKRHKKAVEGDSECFYISHSHTNFAIGFLVFFCNRKLGLSNRRSFLDAMRSMQRDESIDLIAFVGTLPFAQTMLFYMPNRFQPKPLMLCYDILDERAVKPESVQSINNWNFCLYNIDVC